MRVLEKILDFISELAKLLQLYMALIMYKISSFVIQYSEKFFLILFQLILFSIPLSVIGFVIYSYTLPDVSKICDVQDKYQTVDRSGNRYLHITLCDRDINVTKSTYDAVIVGKSKVELVTTYSLPVLGDRTVSIKILN